MRVKVLNSCLACIVICSSTAYAETPISMFPSKYDATQHLALAATPTPLLQITHLVTHNFETERYKKIKAQIIYNEQRKPDHVLVYLFSKKYHRVDVAKVDVDAALDSTDVVRDYDLTPEDFGQQVGLTLDKAVCPDESIDFIAFSPNYDELEQQVTNEVADAAEAHNLKVARLLTTTATRANYINYMACPNLKGNFYDGDANSQLIITYDGAVSAKDINKLLHNQFKFKTVNIWLACEAYHNPLKSAMIFNAQSQKYAAGKNDLTVGPSDKAAACAMEAALDGKPLKKSFRKCYREFDDPDDKWGFDGFGSNYFGM